MKTTRRNFIKAAAIAALFAGTDMFASLGSAAETNDPFAQIPSETLADPFYFLTAEDFKKLIEANFSIIAGNSVTTAQLLKVTQTVRPTASTQSSATTAPRTVTKETFTLTFRSVSGNFSQVTYRLWHPNLGQFNLFLVPGTKVGGKTTLNAVINRI